MSTQQRTTGITVGVVAAVTAIGALLAALVLSSAASGRPDRSAAPARAGNAGIGQQSARRLSRVVAGVRFSLAVPASGWGNSPIVQLPGNKGLRSGRLGISKSVLGSQGAEAIVFWTSFPESERADPCANVLSRGIGRSATDLAAAVASAPGTELVTRPTPVTIGGHAAKHVVLTVRTDVGCDPGFFYSWRSECWGPCWVETKVGDTISVWIVRIRGKRLFFEAVTTTQATASLKREIRQIIDSILFG